MIRSSNMREKLLAAAIIGTFSSQAFSGTVTTDGADIVLKTKGGLEVSTSDKEFRAVAGAECNTVIELKPEHHAASPWHFA